MKDEDLLRRAGDALREPDYLDDPRWERLAAGELSPEEVDELGALQAREEADLPPVDTALEAFRPMDDARHRSIAAMFSQAGDEKKPAGDAKIVELVPPRSRRTHVLAGIALAAAAALALFILLWPQAAPPLPGYTLEMTGGERQVRKPPTPGGDPVPRFTPQSQLEIFLTPTQRVEDPESVALLAYLAGAGTTRKLQLPYRVSPSGTVVIQGRVGELLGSRSGLFGLILVVVRAPDLSRIGDDAQAIEELRGLSGQLFEKPIRITDELDPDPAPSDN